MIDETIILGKYNWSFRLFCLESCDYIDKILNSLEAIKCPKNRIIEIRYDLLDCIDNNGFIYTNSNLRKSVIVINKTSKPKEFFNSLSHENAHLAIHIANENDINLNSEEFCYLVGDIAQAEYQYIKWLIRPCECGCSR